MIPPPHERNKRPCHECLFWNFDGYCWIGKDDARPVPECAQLFIGVCDKVEPVFPCNYNFTPDEVLELVNRFLLAAK